MATTLRAVFQLAPLGIRKPLNSTNGSLLGLPTGRVSNSSMSCCKLSLAGMRMTKRYARIASAQVRQAVNGLDSVLAGAQGAETSDVSHQLVTAKASLPQAISVTT